MGGAESASRAWSISEEAAELHANSIVWDAIYPFFDSYFMSVITPASGVAHFEPKYQALERYWRAGCTCVGLSIGDDIIPFALAMRAVGRERAFVRCHPDRYVLVESVNDILRAKREGKLAVGLNFQGTELIERELNHIELFYKVGIRQMGIAYNQRNSAGNGCHEPADDGLSAHGRRIVEEMNRVGMIVDCSHTGYRTTMDVFEVSEGPVVFSHSNPRALVEHDRNVRDDQIRACAASGGVVGIVGFDGFLPGAEATAQAVVRAIDHIAELVGPEHVGLGLDWVHWDRFPDFVVANLPKYTPGSYETKMDFVSPDQLPSITETLLKRGYSADQIRGILGENWLRVARQVWK